VAKVSVYYICAIKNMCEYVCAMRGILCVDEYRIMAYVYVLVLV
jgi:hypothetical protein